MLSEGLAIRDVIGLSNLEFTLVKVSDYISQSTQPTSISSPLRIRSDEGNSLERLICSPTQTIYV